MSAVLSQVAPPVMAGARQCYHCGAAVAGEDRWQALVDGTARSMCCPGCAAAAEAIVAGGFGDYYTARTGYAMSADVVDEVVGDQGDRDDHQQRERERHGERGQRTPAFHARQREQVQRPGRDDDGGGKQDRGQERPQHVQAAYDEQGNCAD